MSTTLCVIDMLRDIIYLEVDGVHQDWKTYKLELDIKTPGETTKPYYTLIGVC
ncbi:hypothetical protein EV363DRAFT_1165969 [Boletus edulis]|nr:hypothetical protein EV363DRAFT_1165969 [Boletus edulis]